MPSLRYDEGIEVLVSAGSWLTSDIKIYASDGDYTPAVGHTMATFTAAGSGVGTPETLAGKTITDGKLDAIDPVFDDILVTANTITHVIFTITVGGTEYLLCADDVANLNPDGNAITYQVDGTNGVLKV